MQQSPAGNGYGMNSSTASQEQATMTFSGIDYIRATAKPGTTRFMMGDIYGDLANKLCSEGHTEKAVNLYGYKGFTTASITYGIHETGGMLQASGPLAGYVYSLLPTEGWQCPRIDLQTTFVFPTDEELFYEATANAIRSFQAANPARSYPAIGITGYYNQGFTCHVGKRTSAAMGRVYDKGREDASNYPLGTWRHEVEFHNELAGDVCRSSALRSEQAATCAGMVADWFSTRGATIPYCVTGAVEAPRIKHVTTDDEKVLRWLRTNVAPSVAKLISHGLEKEAIEAIMSGYTRPTDPLDG